MSSLVAVHFCQKLPVHFFDCSPEKTTMELTGQRDETKGRKCSMQQLGTRLKE